jgi:hypothetical protein
VAYVGSSASADAVRAAVRAAAVAVDDDWYADENSINPNVITRTTGIRIAVSTRAAPRSPLARLALPKRNIGSLVRRHAYPAP